MFATAPPAVLGVNCTAGGRIYLDQRRAEVNQGCQHQLHQHVPLSHPSLEEIKPTITSYRYIWTRYSPAVDANVCFPTCISIAGALGECLNPSKQVKSLVSNRF